MVFKLAGSSTSFLWPPPCPAIRPAEGWPSPAKAGEGRQKSGSTPRLPTAVLAAQQPFWQPSSRSGSPAAVLAAQQPFWQRPFWQLSSRSGSSAADLAAQQPIWQLSSRSGSSAADPAAQQPIWQLSSLSGSHQTTAYPKPPGIQTSKPRTQPEVGGRGEACK